MKRSRTSKHSYTNFALLISGAIGLVSITAQVRAESGPKNIVDTAVAAGNFETLVAAVRAAGLAQTLTSPGPFTLFAPTDEAFRDLPDGTLESLLKPGSREQLKSILTYHVVPGRVSAREAFGLTNASAVNGQRLEISRPNGKLQVDNANIVATDVKCTNGVIHVIDRVLLPEQRRIPALADQAGQFTTLLAAVASAGLTEVIDGEGPFTVFAPTDEAFKQLPEGTVDSLLKPENKQQLADILKYHVISGRVYSDHAAQASRAKTLLGRVVDTSVSADGLRINDSTILRPDLEAANGVIHVIDSVLLPRPMGPRQAMRTLEDAISRGVPVFNHGNHQQCADIYTAACETVVDSGGDQMPADVVTHLKMTLGRAKHMQHAGSRAWALRHAMDAALASLRQMSY
jgi:uncharacterized surface protein with fasciclin (FAS1) repeats